MGADAETMNQWTPAPALVDGWMPCGGTVQKWDSPCKRVEACVWFNRHDNDWRYAVDSPGQHAATEGIWAMDEATAKRLAVEVAQERLAELDPAPVAVNADASKWHSIAASIAATVAEKNAAYGDSVTRSADIMRVLYPDGIPVSAYGDALLVVRVLDKLSRIATDRDALGESPWRDIAGYALRACEGAGK